MKGTDLETELKDVDQWWEEYHNGNTPYKHADEMEFSDEHMAEFADWIIEKRAVPEMIEALMLVKQMIGDEPYPYEEKLLHKTESALAKAGVHMEESA